MRKEIGWYVRAISIVYESMKNPGMKIKECRQKKGAWSLCVCVCMCVLKEGSVTPVKYIIQIETWESVSLSPCGHCVK